MNNRESSIECGRSHAVSTPCAHDHRPRAEPGGGLSRDAPHGSAAHRPTARRALVLSFGLTAAMMVVEFVGGYWTGSLMLVSDAIHMLSHAAALGTSLLALLVAARPARGFSFGLYRVEILAAFANGIGLAAFSLWIVVEAARRLLAPTPVLGAEVTAVALAGLAVNLATAWILHGAHRGDLNTKSAFLHMLGDTLSSVVILAGGAAIWATGWYAIDPALSLVVAAVVARWSWGLLRDATRVLLEGRPAGLDPHAIAREVKGAFPAVRGVHDLHLWEITSGYTCLSAHLVLPDGLLSEAEATGRAVREYLAARYGIAHAVLALEAAPTREGQPSERPSRRTTAR